MTTTNGNRKLLDLKGTAFCSPAPAASAAGSFVASSQHHQQRQLYVVSATLAYLYAPEDDGWVQVPSPALATAIAAGACGVAAAWSTGSTVGVAALTATAGTTTSITTNQTLSRDMRGYHVQITGGPNAGETKIVASNTIGANSVITFTTASGVAFSASTTYRLIMPEFFVLAAGAPIAGSFRRYDLATNTWITLSQTGLPTIGTDCRLVATPSWNVDGYRAFATGTATAGGASTLTNSAKAWATNQWANSQVRIVSGTGAGQIRTIASNTATTLTTSVAWTTAPDATSVYSIEGNDDFLYLLGNNAVTAYRYQISTNTWTTLAPGVARAGAPGAGLGGQWIAGADAADWQDENAIKNGRYIYSFRAGGSALLDVYDIAANAWIAQTFAPATETFAAGTKYSANGGHIYLQKEATGRWLEFDVSRNEMSGWHTVLYPQGAAIVGDTAFDATYTDGATEITWVYMLLNSSTVLVRVMVI